MFLSGVERDLDLVSGGEPEHGEKREKMLPSTAGLAVNLSIKSSQGELSHIEKNRVIIVIANRVPGVLDGLEMSVRGHHFQQLP